MRIKHISYFSLVICLLTLSVGQSQTNSPAPYCNGGYNSGNCNQPGPSNSTTNFVNDFIDCFETVGGNSNISNCNSGCNGGPNNYANYCQHYLQVTPGQTIACRVQSGITYAQGFAIFVDWNQDNQFNLPNELVTATNGFPPAATSTTISFVVPLNQPNGAYRMRVRCAFATNGFNITPCGTFGYGETEDYTLYIGPIPQNAGVVSATATANSPVCAGQTVSMSIATNYTSGITFTWTGPGGYSNTAQNPFIANASPTISGTYTVVASNNSCPASQTVGIKVIPYPVFTITPSNTTICQGGSVFVAASFSLGTNTASYNFVWSPSTGAGVYTPFLQNTNIAPPLLPNTVSLATMVYSVTVTPTVLGCPTTNTMAITINNPLTPTLTMPPNLCNTYAPVTLTATPSGGLWSGNVAVSPNGLFSPAIAAIPTNTVLYTVTIGSCQVSVSDTLYVAQFNTPALTSSLSLQCVQDPTVNLMTLVQTTVGGTWSGTGVSSNSLINVHTFNPSGLASGAYNLTYNTVSTPAPFYTVCPASTVLVVNVFNPPTPTINPIKPVCDVDPPVQLGVSPPGGLWTLNSGVSQQGVQTPSLCGVGTNQVLYTAGVGTCVASSSATFHVSKFISAALTGTISPLCVTNNPVNLMNIVQNTVGVWGGPNVIGTYSFNPAGLPTNTYVLSYSTNSTPDPNLCKDNSSIVVSVLNPPVPSITQVGPYCSTRGPVQLSVTPNTGSWTAVPYLNPSGVFTPSLASIGGNLVQYIIGTNTCNSQQTKTINVEAFVPSTIVNAIPDLCNSNSPFNLLPITVSNAGIWSGPGVLGANFDPGVTGAGTYTLLYSTASSPSGLCPSQSTVAVNVFSLATPSITKPDEMCNNEASFKLVVSPVGGLFAGNNNGAITTQGIFNPALAIIGDNIVSYSISSGPCIAFAQTTINVQKFISASFANPQDIYFCKSDKALNLESMVLNPGGHWSSNNNGLLGNTGIFDPQKATTGVHIVSYQTGPPGNELLCPDTKTVKVIVNPSPSVTIHADKYKQCAPLEVNLDVKYMDGSPEGTAYWTFGDGSDSDKGQPVRHNFVSAGVYTVVANVVSAAGCSTQAVMDPITVLESPKARFDIEPDDVSISNPDVTLVNKSTVFANNRYEWNISGLGPRGDITPQVSFPAIGKYTIKLRATSFQGCIDEITKTIEVKNDFNVFIPSSFTPNEDGLNDTFIPVFSPYGLDVTSFEMEIFDRWGQSVYHTKDYTKGWDGTLNNKSNYLLKQDNYIYKIRYRDLDGRLYNRMGNVTLITRD